MSLPIMCIIVGIKQHLYFIIIESSLTPNFKKARSVTKLETKDMQGMDKYMIRTMEVDSDGGLATKFYKVNS